MIEDPQIFYSSSSLPQESVEISYQSSQGQFYARLPRHQVVILPSETTAVSNFQQGVVLVKMSEGISKGAVSIC